jgi:hypothetical protein
MGQNSHTQSQGKTHIVYQKEQYRYKKDIQTFFPYSSKATHHFQRKDHFPISRFKKKKHLVLLILLPSLDCLLCMAGIVALDEK